MDKDTMRSKVTQLFHKQDLKHFKDDEILGDVLKIGAYLTEEELEEKVMTNLV